MGAGFGGLAAAIRLQAAGVAVTVLEATDQPGGRAGWIDGAGLRLRHRPHDHHRPQLLDELFRLGGTSLAAEACV